MSKPTIRDALLSLLEEYDHIHDKDLVVCEAIKLVREACYVAARGTDALQTTGNRQLYWKGRADAAVDVRKVNQLTDEEA